MALSWTVSNGATSYNVKRGTANGGPYTTVGTLSGTSYMDSGLTNGTTYYYVVTAVNTAGQSVNSNQASATPSGSSTNVNVTVNVLANRHTISPYVYGGNFPQNAAAITDSGLPLVRWGGNGASTYNWQLGTNNSDNDYYFEDYAFGALNNPADANSTQFIKDVKAAGSVPLMTMVMLPWVAQSAETSTTQGGSDNYHWVFSVSLDGACGSNVDYWNKDAGINLKSDCQTPMVASQSQLERAYYPLLDDHTQSCPGGNCVYRDDWAAALATAFAGGSCPIPYSSIVSCHFYDMDNEIDIWGGTHVDVHPNPSGYDELANTYFTEASKLKTWDPQAVRLGPVLCCWWDYWNGANGADKDNHGGDDFLPWWLNQVHWEDEVAGTRSLDIFDIHAYPDGPDISSYTQAQKQAAAVSIYRDYWDPTLVSPSGTINQQWTTQIQPNRTIAFRIPRLRAIANTIYPGTPLSFTEWSAAFAGESDFSTALGDADAYAILGRERVSLATRWVAPVAANPNYLALKLYTNYDGAHHGFAPVSVAAGNTGESQSLQQLCRRQRRRQDADAYGHQQRPAELRSGAVCSERIQPHIHDCLHAGGKRSPGNCAPFVRLGADANIRALQHHAAGRLRQHRNSSVIGVGPEPRHDHGARRRNRHPATSPDQRFQQCKFVVRGVRQLRGGRSLQRNHHRDEWCSHRHAARHTHRAGRQYCRFLPFHRDWQRWLRDTDPRRVDHRRESAGYSGIHRRKQSVGQHRQRASAGAYRRPVARAVGRDGQWGQHLVHRQRRHPLQRNGQRFKSHCSDQLLGSCLGYAYSSRKCRSSERAG